MIQFFPGQLPPGFAKIFSTSVPTRIRALAVLAGGNAGSRALARKLGFVNERAYRLLAWFKPRDVHVGLED